MKCLGKTNNGRRCSRQCHQPNQYCWQHQSDSQLIGGASSPIMYPTKFKNPTKGQWDIYGKNFCPYTQRAVTYASQRFKHPVAFFDIVTLQSGPKTTSQLAKKLKVNHSTVPMIFDPNNKFIGGSSDLMRI